MNVIVFGASRGVGREAVRQAADYGFRVTAVVRDASRFAPDAPNIKVLQGDATNAADVEAALEGQDAVLCTLGANTRGATSLYSTAARNLVAAMRNHGPKRLIFLSNFGVLGEGSFHPLTAAITAMTRLFVRGTLADHRSALEALRSSDLNWTAVRPMALTNGPRTGKVRVSETGLPPGGWKVSRADVAGFMLGQLRDSRFVGRAPAISY